MVIGSGELGQGIQLWDLRKLEKFKTIEWNYDSNERCPAISYCAFNKSDSDLIVACASHEQPAKGFHMQTLNSKPVEHVYDGIDGTCLTADMTCHGDLVAFGDSKGNLNVKTLDFYFQHRI